MKKTILAIVAAFVAAWVWAKRVVTWPERRRRTGPQFDGWGFAVGSVRGIRDFRVDVDGTLTGVSVQEEWKAGENKAHCISVLAPPTLIALLGKGTSVIKMPADMDADCSCGYYAYFKAKWRGYTFGHGERTIPGVVEGYGKVNLGAKGFRAEKARILGITFDQPWERPGSWDRTTSHAFWACFGIGTLGVDCYGLVSGHGDWAGAAFDVLFWGAMGGLHAWAWIDIRRARRAAKHGCPQGDSHAEPPRVRTPLPGSLKGITFVRGANCRCTWRMLRAAQTVSPALTEKIRAKYPEIKVFDSIDAMVKAHPLDEPPAREAS
jgi:hypothetical protein